MNIIKIINDIIKNDLYTFSLYARQIAGTLVVFIIARYLSVYEYGLFTSYKALSIFILILANMGFESYILVSSQNDISKVKDRIAIFMINAMVLVGFILLFLPFTLVESKILFTLIFIRTFFDGTFFALILPYYQISRKLKLISIINIIYALFVMIIAILSFIFKLSLAKFLLLNIFIGMINFIQCSYYAKIPYIRIIKNYKLIFNLIDKRIVSYMVISLCYLLYSQLQNIFVSIQVSKQDAALYFAANTIASVVILFIGAQVCKIMPDFIGISTRDAEKLISCQVKKVNGITLFILLNLIIFGKFILKLLYGQSYYIQAYWVLLILGLSNVFYGMGKIYITYIMSKDNTKIIVKMQVLSILICISVLLLTYKLGIYSAALAYCLSNGYIGFAYRYKTKKLLNIKKGE